MVNKSLYLALCFVIIISSCKNEEEKPPELDDSTTYGAIQTRIWDQQCTSCHVAGSSFATQSDLVLTADVSYEQLVNRLPNNAAALEDNLELVGIDGLASLYKSYLWEKINAPDIEHFYSDHPFYGAIMPLGGEFLTNGELEFIRQWIINGAPKDSVVADLALLNDEARFEAAEFEPLDPPAQGQQFHLGPFNVAANSDREIFYYEPLSTDEDVYISRVKIEMRPGSHHFIFYTYDNDVPASIFPETGVIRDIYDENGNYIQENLFPLAFQNFVSGTQWPRMDYQFPKGVALRLPAGKGFDMNAHYANRTDEVIQGEVYGNIYTVPLEEVEHVAEILDLNNTNFALPPNQTTTLEQRYFFSERSHIFQLFSHAHEHMTEFRVSKIGGDNDGALLYIAYDWEHPPILELDPPLTIERGEGLKLEATYDNWESRTLRFGLRSEDEMMILFGAFYKD